MSYVNKNLMEGEEIVYRGKIHWLIFVPGAIGLALGLLLLLLRGEVTAYFSNLLDITADLTYLTVAIALVVLLPSAIKFLKALIFRLSTELVITNKRVVAKFGFIRRSTTELNHSKVESFNVEQNILNRILDSGTVVINGTGHIRTPIPNIDSPLEFRLKAMEAIDRYHSS